jgi:catechol 2,3-dioxygenase-like lactoylglutathione lyase family enzyme
VRIDHIQLAAPEGCETAAREFFVSILGMVEEPKPVSLRSRGECWFRGDECSVHVGVDPSSTPQKKAHPAFAVPDLRGLARRLEAAGYVVQWDHVLPGVERFYTEDPVRQSPSSS